MSSAEVLNPPPVETTDVQDRLDRLRESLDIPPIEDILPKVELLESDGEKLETEWHRIVINLLLECLHNHLRGRNDYYANGNSFIYYSETQARNRDYRGPDFFFVKNVERYARLGIHDVRVASMRKGTRPTHARPRQRSSSNDFVVTSRS